MFLALPTLYERRSLSIVEDVKANADPSLPNAKEGGGLRMASQEIMQPVPVARGTEGTPRCLAPGYGVKDSAAHPSETCQVALVPAIPANKPGDAVKDDWILHHRGLQDTCHLGSLMVIVAAERRQEDAIGGYYDGEPPFIDLTNTVRLGEHVEFPFVFASVWLRATSQTPISSEYRSSVNQPGQSART
ncbi:hypothetical protein BDN72DRAFT_861197 [Pluteus cervinus]|uniref:Uncharacterized protein n=1 Tax=Pluteus cervinus TaxID=181527 RepID=A0ACD3AIL0_9AGAR|nr:hypothetical protein BDN72DRAFT_861197 [Pluteus cervinus]